jgi:hypothetical protein
MGVGEGNPCARIVVMRYSGNPTSSKAVTGRGTPRPWTWWHVNGKTCQRGNEAHLDLLFPPEILYLPFRATGDSLVLDIEVFFKALQLGRAPVYGSEAPAKVTHPVVVTAAVPSIPPP